VYRYGVLDLVHDSYRRLFIFSLSLLGSLEGLVDVFSGQTRVAVVLAAVAAATARVGGGAVFIIVVDGGGRGGGASGKHGVGVVGDVF
jgi:hypothetical protein